MKKFVLLTGAFLLVLQWTYAGPVVDDKVPAEHNENSVNQPHDYNAIEEGLLKKLNAKCAQRDVSSCVMLKLVTYMNRMLKKASIEVSGDLEITQTSTEVEVDESSRSMPLEGMTEEAQLTHLIADKMWTFVKTRSLRYRMLDDTDLVISANPERDGSLNLGMSLKPAPASEERKQKGGNMGAIIAAAAVKIGILKALAFKALVFLVGKALIVSKIALVLAVIIGLKKLFSHQKHVTYEVVSHPHHSHSHHESSGHEYEGHGWGRSYETPEMAKAAQELAYSAQKPVAS